ncbi:hypothetical protein QE152_g32381 [Popillia japonica]|uniref:Uncharacterized protein n=1 Tax=Popillia japonica TaxID=7064 RepID=A0AAW1IZJ8_POPJA
MDKLQKPTDMAMVLKDFQNYKRIQDRLNDDRKKQQRDINILLIEKHSLTDELAAIMEKSKQIQIRYKYLHSKISANQINAKKMELAQIKVRDKTQKFQTVLKNKSRIESKLLELDKQLPMLEQQKKTLLQEIVENKAKLDKKIKFNKT